MNQTNMNYPHPVLSSANEDYINSLFDIEINGDPSIEGEHAIINVSYTLVCEGLQAMVDEGKAKVAVYLDSTVAEFRRMDAFPAGSRVMDIIINKNEINRSLLVKGYIVAAAETTTFSLPEHNKEIFGNIPFTLRKGDILALALHSYNIPLESYDPLADRPSIFAIRKQSDRPKEEISADFSGSKITIWLNEDTHEKYRKLYNAPETRSFLSTFFAAPVLVDALHFMKNMSEDERSFYETRKWYQVISHRLSQLKINLAEEISMTKVVNLVLPRIFSSSIESMTKVFEATLKGGERDEN